MTADQGSDTGRQRTVAELLEQYGGDARIGGGRRRRRAAEPAESSDQRGQGSAPKRLFGGRRRAAEEPDSVTESGPANQDGSTASRDSRNGTPAAPPPARAATPDSPTPGSATGGIWSPAARSWPGSGAYPAASRNAAQPRVEDATEELPRYRDSRAGRTARGGGVSGTGAVASAGTADAVSQSGATSVIASPLAGQRSRARRLDDGGPSTEEASRADLFSDAESEADADDEPEVESGRRGRWRTALKAKLGGGSATEAEEDAEDDSDSAEAASAPASTASNTEATAAMRTRALRAVRAGKAGAAEPASTVSKSTVAKSAVSKSTVPKNPELESTEAEKTQHLAPPARQASGKDVPAGLEDAKELDEGLADGLEDGRANLKAWAVLVAQGVLGAVGGAALWIGFRYLWLNLPVVALAAAVVATAGLVLVVRTIRGSEDLRTTMLAVFVGLTVTISPAVLLLTSVR